VHGQDPRGYVRWSSSVKAAARFAPLVLAIGALAVVFRGLDFQRVEHLFTSRGPLLLTIMIPWGIVVMLDANGWRLLLARIGRRVSFLRLLGVRLSAEAVLMSVPSGSFVSDGLTPHLLRSRCGVPITEGLASIAARKCVLGVSQAFYLGVAAAFGSSALAAAAALAGVKAGALALMVLALFLLVASIVGARFLARGNLGAFLLRLLARVPSRRLQAFLREHGESFTHTDAHLAKVFHGRLQELAVPVGCYAVAWFIEAFETYLILTFLGAGLRFREAMPMEASLATLRVLVFFVPAGLGIQDLGYALFLKALAVDDAASVAAAFVLLKRLKEALWIAFGYFLFLKQPELKGLEAGIP
jgi:uncharacterized protein (TIRG00374 family)